VRFAGMEIETCKSGFIVHQREYISKLKPLSRSSDFAAFSSLRARLSWVTHSRPDVCCAVNQSAQVTQTRFDKEPATHISKLNKIIRHLRSVDLPLKFGHLDKESLQLTVYSDASFANNDDLSSQLGYVIFLSDKDGCCSPLHYSSHKSKRVTRSVLGGEVMAFADAFDMSIIIRHDLANILNRKLPISILTDSLSLFDVISKSTITAERRLLIDLAAAKAAYAARELEHVGFIRTQYNPADSFTKVSRCPILEDILRNGKIAHPIEQWISRGNISS
jgi:hypothetical protein